MDYQRTDYKKDLINDKITTLKTRMEYWAALLLKIFNKINFSVFF